MSFSFEQARDLYLKSGPTQSAHTLAAYMRAIDLFLEYLDDKTYSPQLPIQSPGAGPVRGRPLETLSGEDIGLLYHFALWLQTIQTKSGAPYSQATRELRLTGVLRWGEFLAGRGLFPSAFSWAEALSQLKAKQARPVVPRADKAVETLQDLRPLFTFYAQQEPGPKLAKSPTALARWELGRLRNQALIETLAESGGQISAILALNVSDLAPADSGQGPLSLQIRGKSDHPYPLILAQSLVAVRRYIDKRALPPAEAAKAALFISHDPKHQGQRMSRIIAWRIVQRAAKGAGLAEVSPHDLRHWRAKQLIEAGHSMAELKQLLGHRSAYTVRVYYGHWLAEREAAQKAASEQVTSDKEGGD